MMSKKYANVIEGLNYILDIKQKDEMNLDFSLLSNLTYSILNIKVTESASKDETPAESEEVPLVDEEEFDVLSSELTMLEEQLEESEDEKEEKAKSKNDQQFLINQLSALFEKIQKMVGLRVNVD